MHTSSLQSSRPISITWGVFSGFVVLLEVQTYFTAPSLDPTTINQWKRWKTQTLSKNWSRSNHVTSMLSVFLTHLNQYPIYPPLSLPPTKLNRCVSLHTTLNPPVDLTFENILKQTKFLTLGFSRSGSNFDLLYSGMYIHTTTLRLITHTLCTHVKGLFE